MRECRSWSLTASRAHIIIDNLMDKVTDDATKPIGIAIFRRDY